MSEGEYIWISSIVGGVTRLHIPTGKSDYYQYNEDARLSSLSHSDAYGVVALDNDSYIAVTWNGYTLLAPEENDPSKLSATPYTNTSFLQYRNVETRMISVYYDKEGILWIGLSILILDSILICNITAKNIMKSLLRWLTKMVEFGWALTMKELCVVTSLMLNRDR